MDITTVLTYLKDLLATIMTLLMMVSPAFGGNGAAYTAKNPDELITSFAVVSDIHVETNNPKVYKAYGDLLEGIKAGENVKTTVFLGDNVMNGQELENIFFYTALRAVNPSENKLVVMGNHDIGNGEGNYDSFRESYLGYNHVLTGERYEKPYYYKVIDGCYFVCLAIEDLTVNETVISEEQLSWLEGVLDEAEAAEAPIFVFNHHPMTYVTGDNKNAIADILVKYDNISYFHGHIHNKLEEGSFYEDHGIPSFNLPRSTEVVDYGPGDGIVVEVYENEILVRGRNFITGEWLEGLEYTYTF